MNIYIEAGIGILMSLGFTFIFAISVGFLGYLASLTTKYK